MPAIDGHTRDWLEQQLAYHSKMLAKHYNQRERTIQSIKRKATMIKELNREMKKFKKLKDGIEKLLQEENWEV